MKRHVLLLMTGLLLILVVLGWNSRQNPLPQVEASEVVAQNALHPVVEERKNEWIQRAEQQGIQVVVTDGYRSVEEQNALYAQGRTTQGEIVTQARGGESYHNYGLAIDFALRTPDGELVWDMERDDNGNGKADWTEAVEIAKELGFNWGGDWPGFKDYPHLEMTFGLSLEELQAAEQQNT
ncbi:M15 family metallopeptidase [Marinococcus halophilus]|uniref:M15 family metallopeptidase n=1 Tax=Marinococcus halophilus TaxID=1371 RepID=UPI001FD1277C|nr:M15 family metallopeptidase [Marinococcus halophilus]